MSIYFIQFYCSNFLLLKFLIILLLFVIQTKSNALTFNNNETQQINKLNKSFVNNLFKQRLKRERAFELLKLESRFENANEKLHQLSNQIKDNFGSMHRDDALSDEKCQKLCNEKLKSGLDMVKAHSSFGSVGVPSVIDELDLKMFCKLDAIHDKCLKGCGFDIHFNMRNYVCKDHFFEMVSNLACYERASIQLKQQCGAKRCGPYSELEISLLGFAERCRTLICDLNCTENILIRKCGKTSGLRAAKFLLDYSRIQISTWIKDISKTLEKSIDQIIPPSCLRLFCERFDLINCISITESSTQSFLPIINKKITFNNLQVTNNKKRNHDIRLMAPINISVQQQQKQQKITMV